MIGYPLTIGLPSASYTPRPLSAVLLRLLCHHPCNPLPHPSVPRAADKAAKLEAEKKAAADKAAKLEAEKKAAADKAAKLEAEKKAAADEAAKLEAEKKAAAGASALGQHRPLPNQHTLTHLSPSRTRHLTSPTVTTHYQHAVLINTSTVPKALLMHELDRLPPDY